MRPVLGRLWVKTGLGGGGDDDPPPDADDEVVHPDETYIELRMEGNPVRNAPLIGRRLSEEAFPDL